MTGIDAVRNALAAWPAPVEATNWEGPHGRLLAASLLASSSPASVGPKDLLALTRQVLLHERLSQGGTPPLRVPTAYPWPNATDWREAGLEISETTQGILLLSVTVWRPTWAIGDLSAVDLATSSPDGILLGDRRIPSLSRRLPTEAADPFVTDLVGVTSYRTAGQREAIRAAVSAPPGAIIYVVLPTGTGKSLVGLVPGLLRTSGTTVVIVPTVALALDQERYVHDLLGGRTDLPRELAYVGSRPDSVNAAIRTRLMEGRQPVIFTSPESAVSSLGAALYALARTGRLSHLVIDEAHLVGAWGDSFRPDFQQLPGLRLDLLRECDLAGTERFRTVLMTATLTTDSLSDLDELFEGDPTAYVSSVFIRPEPRYVLGPCSSEAERQSRLIEAATYLPRPMIIYTTRRADAEACVRDLRQSGFRRVAAFHGATPTEDRENILQGWRGGRNAPTLDIVVGTSAFGLGVDLQDVRSVVHACMPESVDRYYQEVGRSGRDGEASVALWLPYANRDLRIATQVSHRQQIGGQKGFERWRSMTDGAERLGGNKLRVDLGSLPSYLDDPSEKNRYWNLNTLTQMARADLISVEAEAPPHRDEVETQEEWEARRNEAYERFRRTAVVSLRAAGGLRKEADWAAATTPMLQRTLTNDAASLHAIIRLAQAEACWVDTFRTTYTIPPGTTVGDGTSATSTPIGACVGCPYCQPETRTIPPESSNTVVPTPRAARFHVQLAPALLELFGSSHALTVFVSVTDIVEWRRQVRRALEGCVRNGVVRVVIPPEWLPRSDLGDLHKSALHRYVWLDTDLGSPPHFNVPTVVVHSPKAGALIPRVYYRNRSGDSPRLLLVPFEASDPERPHVRLRDFRAPRLDMARFLASV